MQIVINVPDDFVEPVKDKLAVMPTGLLETIALDAILKFLMKMAEDSPKPNPH